MSGQGGADPSIDGLGVGSNGVPVSPIANLPSQAAATGTSMQQSWNFIANAYYPRATEGIVFTDQTIKLLEGAVKDPTKTEEQKAAAQKILTDLGRAKDATNLRYRTTGAMIGGSIGTAALIGVGLLGALPTGGASLALVVAGVATLTIGGGALYGNHLANNTPGGEQMTAYERLNLLNVDMENLRRTDIALYQSLFGTDLAQAQIMKTIDEQKGTDPVKAAETAVTFFDKVFMQEGSEAANKFHPPISKEKREKLGNETFDQAKNEFAKMLGLDSAKELTQTDIELLQKMRMEYLFRKHIADMKRSGNDSLVLQWYDDYTKSYDPKTNKYDISVVTSQLQEPQEGGWSWLWSQLKNIFSSIGFAISSGAGGRNESEYKRDYDPGSSTNEQSKGRGQQPTAAINSTVGMSGTITPEQAKVVSSATTAINNSGGVLEANAPATYTGTPAYTGTPQPKPVPAKTPTVVHSQ